MHRRREISGKWRAAQYKRSGQILLPFRLMVQAVTIRTKNSEIWVDAEGILRVRPDDGFEIDLEEAKACFAIYRQLGFDKNKVLQLLYGEKALAISAEARDYVAKHGREFFLASAVISSSLPVRIIVNFFNAFYKHEVPFKMFRTEEEALAWLRKHRK